MKENDQKCANFLCSQYRSAEVTEFYSVSFQNAKIVVNQQFTHNFQSAGILSFLKHCGLQVSFFKYSFFEIHIFHRIAPKFEIAALFQVLS